eukprot:scaffold7_cov378-Prasinococcus_capsulatus_cf.AAC.21
MERVGRWYAPRWDRNGPPHARPTLEVLLRCWLLMKTRLLGIDLRCRVTAWWSSRTGRGGGERALRARSDYQQAGCARHVMLHQGEPATQLPVPARPARRGGG